MSYNADLLVSRHLFEGCLEKFPVFDPTWSPLVIGKWMDCWQLLHRWSCRLAVEMAIERFVEEHPMPNHFPTWGHLDGDTPFTALFPDGMVPLISPWPRTIERGGESVRCYTVAWRYLTDDQLASLAEMIFKTFDDCESIEEAVQYICEEGLPLRASWFSGVGTRRMGLLNLP